MTDVIVPAHNEAEGIADVLNAIRGSEAVGKLIVVLDRCTDDTPAIAAGIADELLPIDAGDKGTAMAAGLSRVESSEVVFIDADLVWLLPWHVTALAGLAPLDGQLVGIRGQSPTGIRYPRWIGLAPSLSGERRVPTWLARSVTLAGAGWEAETRLNAAVARLGLPWRHIMLKGVSNRTKAVSNPLAFAGEMIQVAGTSIGNAPELVRYSTRPGGRGSRTGPPDSSG